MKIFLLAVLIFSSGSLFCQSSISGKVVSDKGEGLHGASVFISNTKIGTTTNANGEFTLEHLPNGNIQLVITFVGYETTTAFIVASDRNKKFIIKMQPLNNELQDVVVGNFDKRGWQKWGKIFTEAFLGTSVFAKNCLITDTDAVNFSYNKKTNILRAYAYKPILIDNNALGYHVAVTLADFSYEVNTKIVDYQTYTLFTDIDGTEDQQLEWNANRQKVYNYSLLHFMRALYNNNLKNEGFYVRRIENKPNIEKQRVQAIYNNKYEQIRDSLKSITDNEASINKQVEKLFNKDSLTYYKAVLEEADETTDLHFEPVNFKDIAKFTDSNTVIFHFNNDLQVTYVKEKEPEEYLQYRRSLYLKNSLITKDDVNSISLGYPNTILSLSQGIPVEISEDGYFTNIDLFMNGFWGWWEKMAVTLPYEYEP